MTHEDVVDGLGPDAEARVFTILCVCTANVCRSPMAEHLLRRSLAAASGTSAPIQFNVRSAGARGWDGAPMDASAAAELRRLGGDPSAFQARSFTASLGADADLILTATTVHRRFVLEEVPRALHKTFTLLEFAHLVAALDVVKEAAGHPAEVVRRAAASRGAARLDEYDVADPYGRSLDAHQEVAAALGAATRTIADVLIAPDRKAPPQ